MTDRGANITVRPHEDPAHPMQRFFEPLRRKRAEHYAAQVAGQARKRRAVITIVHNEAVFLPIWLAYYSRFFDPADIYVLDHQSTDGSTDGPGFVRVPVAHDSVDHTWMVRMIEGHQRELFERYDVVLTTDVDEIVAPVPDWGTLGKYLDRFDEEFVNCLGYEILHLRDAEGPFLSDRPVLGQRGHWFPNDAYDKPALASGPTTWEPGFHARSDGRFNLDPDLRLIHLHRMDFDICLARHRQRGRMSWNRDDVNAGWASHNRITDERAFERWFYEDSCFEDRGIRIALEAIPPIWRDLF